MISQKRNGCNKTTDVQSIFILVPRVKATASIFYHLILLIYLRFLFICPLHLDPSFSRPIFIEIKCKGPGWCEQVFENTENVFNNENTKEVSQQCKYFFLIENFRNRKTSLDLFILRPITVSHIFFCKRYYDKFFDMPHLFLFCFC